MSIVSPSPANAALASADPALALRPSQLAYAQPVPSPLPPSPLGSAAPRPRFRAASSASTEQLALVIVRPPTSERNQYCTARKMLDGERVWTTGFVSKKDEESFIVRINDDDGEGAPKVVEAFTLAVYGDKGREREMKVEAFSSKRGGAYRTLVPWGDYGAFTDGGGGFTDPSAYSTTTVAVQTTALTFKVSVRCKRGGGMNRTGVAIFNVVGLRESSSIVSPDVVTALGRFVPHHRRSLTPEDPDRWAQLLVETRRALLPVAVDASSTPPALSVAASAMLRGDAVWLIQGGLNSNEIVSVTVACNIESVALEEELSHTRTRSQDLVRVVCFYIATAGQGVEYESRVEEVGEYGHVGGVLLPWAHYGRFDDPADDPSPPHTPRAGGGDGDSGSGSSAQSSAAADTSETTRRRAMEQQDVARYAVRDLRRYAPDKIEVTTAATAFRLSARHHREQRGDAGTAIFRVVAEVPASMVVAKSPIMSS